MKSKNTFSENNGMNIDAYEDKAINKSRIARNVALGAAVLGGGGVAAAAVANAGGTTEQPVENESLTIDDVVDGAQVSEAPEVVESTETEYVQVQNNVQTEEKPESDEINVTWDESDTLYVDGEKVMSVESGTVDGHSFMVGDVDGDDMADFIAIDANDNGVYESNEVFEMNPFDNVRMGHATAHSSERHIFSDGFGTADYNSDSDYADNNIHNNFDDEKIGESYQGDYAENNPDYNSRADVEFEDTTDDFDLAEAESDEDDSFSSMMGGEEFLG